MPFQSEKQRRFLWLKHPDIAKRWAHEYPNKSKLPMYAHAGDNNKDEDKVNTKENTKQAALDVLRGSLLRYMKPENSQNTANSPLITKKSNSILQYLDVPHTDKPVAAGEENVKPKGSAMGENKGDSQSKPKVSPGALFNIKDAAIKPIVEELARLFSKHAAVIRLGKKHRHHQTAPQTQKNVGLDLPKLNANIAALKQQRLFSANPLPIGMQAQPSPVASYPGMNSAPQSQPQIAANKPAAQSPAANPIGLKGPLNTKGGVPTFAQNLTGNAAFGNTA